MKPNEEYYLMCAKCLESAAEGIEIQVLGMDGEWHKKNPEKEGAYCFYREREYRPKPEPKKDNPSHRKIIEQEIKSLRESAVKHAAITDFQLSTADRLEVNLDGNVEFVTSINRTCKALSTFDLIDFGEPIPDFLKEQAS